eukprot:GEMP01001564.1.p1 GENE.GEMP01001564.1~~GEMP01001564.1.p1  ORF type:complete len:1656 (-),score=459.53 GEMP01001564.1:228-5195(-)
MLSRREFVNTFDALLARSDSAAIQGSESELHELYDILDPQARGSVSIEDVDRLLRQASQIAPEQETVKATSSSGPIPRLRQWMLKQQWLFIDLLKKIGEAPVSKAEFQQSITIPASFLPAQMIDELFDVMAFGSAKRLCPKELCERLVDSASFKETMRKRAVRHVVRKVLSDQKRDITAPFRKADQASSGYLSKEEQYAVLKSLGSPDLSFMDKRLVIDSESYETLVQILLGEARSMVLLQLQRGCERLEAQIDKFESRLKEVGQVVTMEQARKCLPEDLRASDFFDLLVKATVGPNPAPFKITEWVDKGKPKWPTPEAMLTRIFGGIPTPARKIAPLEHQLTLLFYKIHQTQRKNNLTDLQAFECLAPTGKSIHVEELRNTVFQLLNLSSVPTNEELGLPKKGPCLSFDEFRDKISFELAPFQKSLEKAFAPFRGASMPLAEFVKFFVPSEVTKVQSENLLRLVFGPHALALKEVQRQPLELFLGTVQAAPKVAHADPLEKVREKMAKVEFTGSDILSRAETEQFLAPLTDAEKDLVIALAEAKDRGGVRLLSLRALCLPADEHCISVHIGPANIHIEGTLHVRYHFAGTNHYADAVAPLDLHAEHSFFLAKDDSLATLLATYDSDEVLSIVSQSPTLEARAVLKKADFAKFLSMAHVPLGVTLTQNLAFGKGTIKVHIFYQRKSPGTGTKTSSHFKNASIVSEVGAVMPPLPPAPKKPVVERSTKVDSLHLAANFARHVEHLYVEVRSPQKTTRSAPCAVPDRAWVVAIPLDIPAFTEAAVDVHVVGLDGQLLAYAVVKMESTAPVQDASFWFPLYQACTSSPTKGQLIGRVLVQGSVWIPKQLPKYQLYGVLPSGVLFSQSTEAGPKVLRDIIGVDLKTAETLSDVKELLPPDIAGEISVAMREVLREVWNLALWPWALVHWVALRLVARTAPSYRDVHHNERIEWTTTGCLPMSVTKKVLEPVLSPALWAFVSNKKEWRIASDNKLDGDFFDYQVFLSDLQHPCLTEHASGVMTQHAHLSTEDARRVGASFSPARNRTDVPHLDSKGSKGPTCHITIAQAVHLHKAHDDSPNSFVVLQWSSLGLEVDRTQVIYKSTCPAWLHECDVTLPTFYDGQKMHYPDGYKSLELTLMVMHAPSGGHHGPPIPLGRAHVAMAPLCYLPEIDGYYNIEGVDGTGEHGQIRLTVRPSIAATPLAKPVTDPATRHSIDELRKSLELRTSYASFQPTTVATANVWPDYELNSSTIPAVFPSETRLRFAAQLREHETSLQSLTESADLKKLHMDNMRDLETCVSSMLRGRKQSPPPGSSVRIVSPPSRVPTSFVGSKNMHETAITTWPEMPAWRNSSTITPPARRSVEDSRDLLFNPRIHRMEVVDDGPPAAVTASRAQKLVPIARDRSPGSARDVARDDAAKSVIACPAELDIDVLLTMPTPEATPHAPPSALLSSAEKKQTRNALEEENERNSQNIPQPAKASSSVRTHVASSSSFAPPTNGTASATFSPPRGDRDKSDENTRAHTDDTHCVVDVSVQIAQPVVPAVVDGNASPSRAAISEHYVAHTGAGSDVCAVGQPPPQYLQDVRPVGEPPPQYLQQLWDSPARNSRIVRENDRFCDVKARESFDTTTHQRQEPEPQLPRWLQTWDVETSRIYSILRS